MKTKETDFLIVGSGLAGLACALKIADRGKVTILTKSTLGGTNTAWAQGGIAAVSSEGDSFESHIDDTLRAGAGLCHLDVVKNYIEQAPDRIRDLMSWGVAFDEDPTSHAPSLTREGGHSFRRILHHEDTTGREIHRAVVAQCLRHPNIEFIENKVAIDLIMNRQLGRFAVEPLRCVGLYYFDKETRAVEAIRAGQVILATGGAGKTYLYTSNWEGATGDGIAMAWRAGARVANLEFMQFHPTCLYHPQARNFLVSEALRGEGGELVNAKGEAFMKETHARGSLAPRDIVARAIDREMKKSGADCVFLDITKHSREYLSQRFPEIFRKCLEYGIDISRQPIPVVPAAHYLCGGILTDLNGKSDIAHLWALGETACTGFHGANRLASNSLLECLTMAHNCSLKIGAPADWPAPAREEIPEWEHPAPSDADELIVIHHIWDEIRRLMWNYVGIVRSNKRLERAAHRLKNIMEELKDYYSNYQIHPDIIELRNIAIVADLTVQCALKRRESRGIHFNLDSPEASETPGEDVVLHRGSALV